NMFLATMLDPFVNGRGGVPGGIGLGFAPEQPKLPPEIANAYNAVFKAPVAPVAYAPRWGAWASAYGGCNNRRRGPVVGRSGDPIVIGSHDLIARAGGYAAGLDHRIGPDTVVGLALAGGFTNWSLSAGLGGGKSDAFQTGVYGVTRAGPAYLAAAFAYTHH